MEPNFVPSLVLLLAIAAGVLLLAALVFLAGVILALIGYRMVTSSLKQLAEERAAFQRQLRVQADTTSYLIAREEEKPPQPLSQTDQLPGVID